VDTAMNGPAMRGTRPRPKRPWFGTAAGPAGVHRPHPAVSLLPLCKESPHV